MITILIWLILLPIYIIAAVLCLALGFALFVIFLNMWAIMIYCVLSIVGLVYKPAKKAAKFIATELWAYHDPSLGKR